MRAAEYVRVVNLYNDEKISLNRGGHIQEWYGVKQGKGKLICAKCGGIHEAKGIAAVHGGHILEWIYQCECGNIMVSRTHGITLGRDKRNLVLEDQPII